MMTLKIKTSDLIGTDLDLAVAHCVEQSKPFPIYCDGKPMSKGNYSTDWSLAGPIIEREQIATWYEKHKDASLGLPCWHAAYYCEAEYKGPTLLIAAMRCYVANKFGNEVELIKELTNES
jgi:hypothetical protein